MILRPYQEAAIARVRAAMRRTKRVVLVAPTGFGKTATAARLIETAVERKRRVLFLVHRREIVMDTAKRLGSACGVVMAQEKADPSAPVQVCSVQTVVSREVGPADLVFWDEAHHVAAKSYASIRARYPEAWHVGLTATPERADGASLSDAFDELVVGATMRELVEGGYLAPCEVIAPARSLTGGFAMDPADAVREHGAGRATVVFCQSVRESAELAARLGPRAAHVDGETPKRQRDRALAAFAAGDLDVLCNVFVLTEGWDAPRASVCVLARGCGSTGTYLQMVGRVLRAAPGKDRATVVDLAGVVHEHGLPDEDRAWTLDPGGALKKSEREWISQCLACGAVFLGVKALRLDDGRRGCVRCRAPLPEAPKRAVRSETMGVVRVVASRAERDAELARLQRVAQARGYSPKWAFVRFKEQFGAWPRG